MIDAKPRPHWPDPEPDEPEWGTGAEPQEAPAGPTPTGHGPGPRVSYDRPRPHCRAPDLAPRALPPKGRKANLDETLGRNTNCSSAVVPFVPISRALRIFNPPQGRVGRRTMKLPISPRPGESASQSCSAAERQQANSRSYAEAVLVAPACAPRADPKGFPWSACNVARRIYRNVLAKADRRAPAHPGN